jgi:glycosyltransferase involved in cell wall biosynthesis
MKKKKRILVLHPALAPYRVDFFNSLNENFDADFYFFNENLLNQKFNQDKLKKEIDFNCNYLKKGFNTHGRSFRFGIPKIVRKLQPDIVICPEYNLVNLSVLLYRLRSSKKFKIITICDDNIQIAKQVSFFKKTLRSFFLRNLDAVILTHHDITHWYKSNLKPKAKLLEFPIIRKEKPYLKQLECSNLITKDYISTYNLQNKKVLLFVGRLVAVKNLETLLDAFALVNKKNKSSLLVIIGSGELQSVLEEKIKNLGLEKVVLMLGRLEGNELLAWYQNAGIFILPSTFEPFGAVINEALLAGCYVLSSNLAGGASLIKEDLNGNTFDPNNKKEIVKTIMLNLNRKELFINQGEFRENRMTDTYKGYFDNLIKEII